MVRIIWIHSVDTHGRQPAAIYQAVGDHLAADAPSWELTVSDRTETDEYGSERTVEITGAAGKVEGWLLDLAFANIGGLRITCETTEEYDILIGSWDGMHQIVAPDGLTSQDRRRQRQIDNMDKMADYLDAAYPGG